MLLTMSSMNSNTILQLSPLSFNQLKDDDKQQYCDDINRLGVASGIAQALKDAITSVTKFTSSSPSENQMLACSLDTHSNRIQGYIKYGIKDLYFYKKTGEIVQKRTLCLLDFYIDGSLQRSGIGYALFKYTLNITSTQPDEWAYDRPSPKLLAFLRKHYSMTKYDLQPNRYAIYDGFHL